MKSYKIIIILLIAFGINAEAQTYFDSTYVRKKEEPKSDNAFSWKKMFYGGGVGLSIGNPTYFDLSPVVGYRITDRIHAGVGITYQYYQYTYDNNDKFTTNVYGGSVFGRYYFTKNLFGHGEFEYLNLANYNDLTKRVGVESVLVGGGYIQRFAQYSGIVAEILYDLTNSEYSPYYYSPIIVRLGVNIGF